jgi:propanediol dehydratase small subunit
LADVSVKPGSVFSDKIVVRSIRVESPDITFEGNPMKNNLTKILDNVNAATGGETAPTAEAQAGKKLQVDDFLITGAKVRVGANGPTLALPDIHLTGLGNGPEGITAADLTQRALSVLVRETLKVVASAATDIGKHAAEAGKELGKEAGKTVGEGAEKVGKGIGDLFKKK